jgi:hypothetical protein
LGETDCEAFDFFSENDNTAATPIIAKAVTIINCFLIVPVFLLDEGNTQNVTLQSPKWVDLLNVRQKMRILAAESTYFCHSEKKGI